MVGLNPVLRCLMAVEEGIARGDAIRDVLLRWLDGESRKKASDAGSTDVDVEFRREILEFLRESESSRGLSCDFEAAMSRSKTIYRRTFLSILVCGLEGSAILPKLQDLRDEIEAQLELDMKAHVESLPLKMLVPLLLCMFPAFLILLLGPITQNFMEALQK